MSFCFLDTSRSRPRFTQIRVPAHLGTGHPSLQTAHRPTGALSDSRGGAGTGFVCCGGHRHRVGGGASGEREAAQRAKHLSDELCQPARGT